MEEAWGPYRRACLGPGVVVHTYNTGYLGDKDQEN
jgi:hypothetical protein